MLAWFSVNMMAQQNAELTAKFKKATRIDTHYIYKYESKLILGIYQSYNVYNILIKPEVPFDSLEVPKVKWQSESNHVTGIDFNYDKFGFSLGIRSKPPENKAKTGETEYFNFGFSYGGNRWFVETGIMSFRGFYEANSLLRDSTLTNYYQNPNLKSDIFKIKFWYFTNHHRFAFKSCYGGLYRQLRSRGSWVFGANMHFNEFSTDSSIVPNRDKKYYHNTLAVSSVGSAAILLFGGYALNIVLFKSFFLNFAYVGGPDFQSLTTVTNQSEIPTNKMRINYSGDFRFAFGLNFRKWYYTWTYAHESTRFSNGMYTIITRLNATGVFNIGYRFGVKKPALYQKFQNTWFYNIF